MATDTKNKLTNEICEHLVSAMLSTRGFHASPYSGKIPDFNITAVCSKTFKSFPVRVSTNNKVAVIISTIDKWVNCGFDKNNCQILGEPLKLKNPDIVWILVFLKDNDIKTARYFICTYDQIQIKMIANYRDFLSRNENKRPRKSKSFMCVLREDELIEYEDNWSLLDDILK